MSIKAIDTHCHLHYGPIENLVPNTLTDIMQEGNFYSAYWEKLSVINASAGIEKVLASPFDGVLSRHCALEANEKMFEIANAHEGLYQWVVLDPKNDETFLQAETMLKSRKCVGIKLHPFCHEYSLEEYGEKIFSFAEFLHAVVQIHPEKSAADILKFANRYPNAKFIMAHLGGEKHIEAIRCAKHENVYTDTSGKASLKNLLIEYAVSKIGSEHILFGTDTYAAGAQIGRIEFSAISDRDKENILKNNAEKLFDLENS